MSENDEVKCPECGTIATEKTWDVNNGKCLFCGYVWPTKHEEPLNVTYSGLPVQPHAMPSRIKPQEQEILETSPEQKEQLKSALWKVGIVVLVVVAVILIASIKLPSTPKAISVAETTVITSTEVVATETPPATLTDFFAQDSSSQELRDIESENFDTKQMMFILFACVLILTGFLDRTLSHQIQDATAAIVITIAVLACQFPIVQKLFSLLKSVVIGGHEIMIPWNWFILLFGLGALYGYVRSGKFDLTPANMFFGLLAIVGGIFLKNLGAMQTVFAIDSNPVYVNSSLVLLNTLGQRVVGNFTRLIYWCLIIAMLGSLFEVVKPSGDIKISLKDYFNFKWIFRVLRELNYEGLIFSVIVIVGYILLRSFVHPPEKVAFLVSPMFLLASIIALNFIIASIFRERFDGKGINYTEYVLGNLKVISPYDVIQFQVLVGAFLIIFTGKI